MIDNDIIKSLECCGKYHTNYKDQPCEHCAFNDRSRCVAFLIDDVIGLINRQKAEIERLTDEKEKLRCVIEDLSNNTEYAKAEAVKEFAERLKKQIDADLSCGADSAVYLDEDMPKILDNLVKETVGESE